MGVGLLGALPNVLRTSLACLGAVRAVCEIERLEPDMYLLQCFLISTLLVAAEPPKGSTPLPTTPPLEFVSEFVRQLAAIENIRFVGAMEYEKDKDNIFPNMIHTSTAFKLELATQVSLLNDVHFNAPFKEIPEQLAEIYQRKIELHDQMIELATAFMSDPRADVDYGKLAAEMPKLRARGEFLDTSIFKMTPAVFATLIDMRADSQNHASHLVITKAEKAQLLSKLASSFLVRNWIKKTRI